MIDPLNYEHKHTHAHTRYTLARQSGPPKSAPLTSIQPKTATTLHTKAHFTRTLQSFPLPLSFPFYCLKVARLPCVNFESLKSHNCVGAEGFSGVIGIPMSTHIPQNVSYCTASDCSKTERKSSKMWTRSMFSLFLAIHSTSVLKTPKSDTRKSTPFALPSLHRMHHSCERRTNRWRSTTQKAFFTSVLTLKAI